jgi:predicted ATP-dependent endonuclease of OLD family
MNERRLRSIESLILTLRSIILIEDGEVLFIENIEERLAEQLQFLIEEEDQVEDDSTTDGSSPRSSSLTREDRRA